MCCLSCVCILLKLCVCLVWCAGEELECVA